MTLDSCICFHTSFKVFVKSKIIFFIYIFYFANTIFALIRMNFVLMSSLWILALPSAFFKWFLIIIMRFWCVFIIIFFCCVRFWFIAIFSTYVFLMSFSILREMFICTLRIVSRYIRKHIISLFFWRLFFKSICK